jgi:serine/threonine protein phosphatase PrpC
MLRRSAPDAPRGERWGWPGAAKAPPADAGAVSRWPATSGPPLDVGGASDRGRVRSNNEDSFVVLPVGPSSSELLLVVADGLGGASGGEVASRLAVEAIAETLSGPRSGGESPADALRRAFVHADTAVREAARDDAELEGLGTTLTAALVRWPHVWMAHVGDSRAYLWRDGRMHRLTRDHTMAERMREEGLVAAREPVGRLESMLWNAIGGSTEELEVEQRRERLYPGDGLLLCSDGLTRHLADEELARRASRDLAAGDLCDDLVRAANGAGGEDNVTAVFVRVGAHAPS